MQLGNFNKEDSYEQGAFKEVNKGFFSFLFRGMLRARTTMLACLCLGCALPIILQIESLLLTTLWLEIPVGTVLAWGALVSAAVMPLSEAKTCWLRAPAWALTAFALGWLPLGVWLSGNVRLNFHNAGWRSDVYWILTKSLAAGVLILVSLTLISVVYRSSRRGSAQSIQNP